MPIYGLTDSTPGFKELGRLRLGIPKAEAAKGGPKEIGYFRPDFRPDATMAAAKFAAAYPKQPTEINFRLPFKEIDRCWDAFYEVYNTSGMLGQADGQKWLYLRDNKSGELIVSKGEPLRPGNYPTDENGRQYMPFDKTIPVYSYKNKKGEDTAVFARPTGRLKIFIPELEQAGFVVIITHSVYNIARISAQLAGIKENAGNAGMALPMVPMILSRRKEEISVTINGKKSKQDHFLLNVEINPEWAAAQFAYMDRLMPGVQAPMLALPEATPYDIDEVDETDEPEPTPEIIDQPFAGDRFSEICRNLFASLADDRSAKILESYKGDVNKALAWAEKRAESFQSEEGLTAHVKANWPNFEAFVSPVIAKCNSDTYNPFAVINGIDLLAMMQNDDPEAFNSMDDEQIVAYILDYQK